MSRMDRYYKNESNSNKRTKRNYDLYKTIYEDSEYSNIAGIADIDKINEIDIVKIKNMLKSREEYQNGRELRSFIPKQETPKHEIIEDKDDRIYDIRDILAQAKEEKPEDKYHNLDKTNLDILEELKNKPKKPQNNDELEDIIDNITTTSKLNQLSDNELGLDILEDLKSETKLVSSKTSIQSLLNETQDEKTKTQTNTGLDKSFFTSSLSFGNKDFEELNGVKKQKENKLLKVVLFSFIIVISIAIVILIFKILN